VTNLLPESVLPSISTPPHPEELSPDKSVTLPSTVTSTLIYFLQIYPRIRLAWPMLIPELFRIDTQARNAMPRIPVSGPRLALLQSALELPKKPLVHFTLTARSDCTALLETALIPPTAPILLVFALPKLKPDLIVLLTGCALTVKDALMASVPTGTPKI
jgi:hypothetical protein